ncbi:MAG: hypothetical protein ABWX67_14950, partial [Allosphingosinicella sp.]
GIAAGGWSAPIIVPGLGWEGQGAGLGIAYLDNNARPEAIFMVYDNPAGPNSIRYKIGWNLNANGIATSWTVAPQVPGMGWEGQGAGVAIGQINGGGLAKSDMVVAVYDNPSGANTFRYKIGWDLGINGVPAGWSPMITVPGLGWEGQGAGAALANLDANPRPELVLMAYDAPAGANNFRYTVGWNLNTAGVATSWTSYPQLPGLGWEGQGAGLAITCLDSTVNARTDWIFMAYDNPAGANSFRYRVVKNKFAPTCGIP